MQLPVHFYLLPDVPADHLLVVVLTCCADGVSGSPKLAAPNFRLYCWTFGKDFPCPDAFDGLYDLLRTVHRHRLHQKMDIVLVSANFEKCNFIALADFRTDLFEFLVYCHNENHSTLIRWTNYVIHIVSRLYVSYE